MGDLDKYGGLGDLDKSSDITVNTLTTLSTITAAGLITSGGDAIAKIKTGTYTGDGTTSQAVTGVGFTPKKVIITKYSASAVSVNVCHIKTDQDSGTLCYEQYLADWVDDAILSLDADGFTVDDAGADLAPNANTIVYMYIAFG